MEQLLKKTQKLEKDYKFSSRTYSRYSRYMTIPAVLLTSTASIFSFLSTSQFVSPQVKDYSIITVAIFSSLASTLQTIGASCEFNIKALKFREASHELNKIHDKVFFEIENPNEENFIDKIEKQIELVKTNCKFLPLESPIKTSNKYEEV
jgi:hypothetical protein